MTSFILNIVSTIGFTLQFLGFVWMLKYYKNPLEEYLEKWKSVYQNKHDDYDDMIGDVDYYNFEPRFLMQTHRATRDDVPKKFIKFWEFRKKWSVRIVIIGFIVQALQITISFWMQS